MTESAIAWIAHGIDDEQSQATLVDRVVTKVRDPHPSIIGVIVKDIDYTRQRAYTISGSEIDVTSTADRGCDTSVFWIRFTEARKPPREHE